MPGQLFVRVSDLPLSTDQRHAPLQRSAKSWVLLGLLVIFWGSSFALTKIAVEAFTPQWVVALRLSMASLILVPFVYASGKKLPPLRSWSGTFWLAMSGNVLPFLVISWGVQYIASGLAGMLMAVMPLVIVSMAYVFLPDEKPGVLTLGGVAIGFIGAIILIGPDKLLSIQTQGLAVWGQIAVLAGAMFYAGHTILARKVKPMGMVERAAIVCLIASIMSIGIAVWSDPGGLLTPSIEAWAAVIVLAIFPTAIANIVLYHLLARAGAGFVSYVNYLIPVFAALLGMSLLGEHLSLQAFMGFALIIGGITVSELKLQPGTRT